MALITRETDGSLSTRHFNAISKCLTHDAVFVAVALQNLFFSEVWASFGIMELAIWCDNAKHFKNKVLLAYLSDITRINIPGIHLCFFEPYHGKSIVDGMFGLLTKWMKRWVKTCYLNTTEDLLQCFTENNKFHPSPHLNYFYELDVPERYWKEVNFREIHGVKLKNVYIFSFQYELTIADKYDIYTLDFDLDKDTNKIFLNKFNKCVKKLDFQKKDMKKQVKYSKVVEVVNGYNFSAADESFLKKKAKDWGFPY